MEFKTSLHYPSHAPDPAAIGAAAQGGWKIDAIVITPPESQFAVHGLLILWHRLSRATFDGCDSDGSFYVCASHGRFYVPGGAGGASPKENRAQGAECPTCKVTG